MPTDHVFLCHSADDKAIVRVFHRQLLADGFAPWLDEHDLIPGQPWESVIRSVIRNSRVVVVFLSRGSVQKTGFVQREIRIALDAADERPPGTIYVIPARIEPCPIPEGLADRHAIDLFAPDGYVRLCHAIRTVQGVPARTGAPAAPAARLRYDGLYLRSTGDAVHYLRFRPAGVCYTVSSTGSPRDVARWLGGGGSNHAHGPFEVSGDTVTVSVGRDIEYRGTLRSAGEALDLRVRNRATGYESSGVYGFEAVRFPN